MLVLSRKQEESIRIGEDVVVMVVSVQGNRVRLGIEAPAKIVIRRSELACQVGSTKNTAPTARACEQPTDLTAFPTVGSSGSR